MADRTCQKPAKSAAGTAAQHVLSCKVMTKPMEMAGNKALGKLPQMRQVSVTLCRAVPEAGSKSNNLARGRAGAM